MRRLLKPLKGRFEGEIVLKWSATDGCSYWYMFLCLRVPAWKVLNAQVSPPAIINWKAKIALMIILSNAIFASLVKTVKSHFYTNIVSTDPCNMPLGLANGLIKDEQFSSFSAYNNDFATYGAHRARLNLTAWPPGYRARYSFSGRTPWIRIDLRKELTITGIATQGYGDASVAEWVTSYRLMYAAKQDFDYFKDIHGKLLVSAVLLDFVVTEWYHSKNRMNSLGFVLFARRNVLGDLKASWQCVKFKIWILYQKMKMKKPQIGYVMCKIDVIPSQAYV